MIRLTPDGTQIVADIAARHGMSTDAVETLLVAVANGHGTQAQFNHFELGGMGQWSRGGMTMIGDMFNNALKARVAALAQDLSQLLATSQVFAPMPQTGGVQAQSQSGGSSLFVAGPGAPEWPAELGQPSSTGTQNAMRYGVFPATRRLAIQINDVTEVYDTGDHQISGVSQQQGGDQSLTFTSQRGLVRIADLPQVSAIPTEQTQAPSAQVPPPLPQNVQGASTPQATPTGQPQPFAPATETAPVPTPPPVAPDTADAIIALIQKLADLRAAGILSDAEFDAKKSELLGRL